MATENNQVDRIDEILSSHSVTKLDQLTDAFWDEFGGAKQIAGMVRQAYLQAKEGSMTQIRIADMLMKLFVGNDSKQKSMSEELDEMTEGQLKAILKETFSAGQTENSQGIGPAARRPDVNSRPDQNHQAIQPGQDPTKNGDGKGSGPPAGPETD